VHSLSSSVNTGLDSARGRSSSLYYRLLLNKSCVCYNYSGVFIDNEYGAGSGPIWLSGLRCTGTETSIADCSHGGWGVHNCQHSQDASVSCSTRGMFVSVKLHLRRKQTNKRTKIQTDRRQESNSLHLCLKCDIWWQCSNDFHENQLTKFREFIGLFRILPRLPLP